MSRHERRAQASKGADVGDTTIKFGGRTLEVKILINTNESLDEVVARLITPAKGPGKRMVVVSGGEVSKEDAEKFWSTLIPIAEQQAKSGGVS